MRYWLVNESAPHYNLGLEKARRWLLAQGHEVQYAPFSMEIQQYDRVWFSVIFSWHLSQLVQHVLLAKDWGKDVAIGGPATSVNCQFIESQTGIRPFLGVDMRFERQPGDYLATFTHRGCVRHCPWCIVPKSEGDIIEIPDFIPAKMIHDNNFPATSERHQVAAVERLLKAGIKRVDFDQAWDARLFDQWHVDLYKKVKPLCWRFSFDFMGIEPEIERVCHLLQRNGILSRNRVSIFCLVGFKEGAQSDCYRAHRIAELGASPFVMRYVPLDSLVKYPPAVGWDDTAEMIQLARYYNLPKIWTSGADFEQWLKRIKPHAPIMGQSKLWD